MKLKYDDLGYIDSWMYAKNKNTAWTGGSGLHDTYSCCIVTIPSAYTHGFMESFLQIADMQWKNTLALL